MYTKGIDGDDIREAEARNDIFTGSPSIRSEGQLYNFQNGYTPPITPEPESLPASANGITGRLKSIFVGLDIDDLLLIAIGILILLDGSEDNDVLLVFILALLFL